MSVELVDNFLNQPAFTEFGMNVIQLRPPNLARAIKLPTVRNSTAHLPNFEVPAIV
jgi:hypothetical protein